MAIPLAAILRSRPTRREVHTGGEKDGYRAGGRNERVGTSQVRHFSACTARYSVVVLLKNATRTRQSKDALWKSSCEHRSRNKRHFAFTKSHPQIWLMIDVL